MGCVHLDYKGPETGAKGRRNAQIFLIHPSLLGACIAGSYREAWQRHSNECHLLSRFPSGVIRPTPINQLHRKLMNELKREPVQ